MANRFHALLKPHSIFSPPRQLAIILYSLLLAIVTTTWGSRLWLLTIREFDQDEFVHFHDAWCISKGLRPYCDFWEHHVPLLHLLFAPCVRFFNVTESLSEAIELFFLGRGIMWVFLAGILVATAWLGSLWRNRLVGAVGTVFLVNTEIFLDETLEFRPDVPSTFFWLSCLVAVVRGLQLEDERNPRSRVYFLVSGLLLGAGVMTTQKLLVGLPGFAVAALLYFLRAPDRASLRTKLMNTGFLLAGVLLPVLSMMMYFYFQNCLWNFIHSNFLFALKFKAKRLPHRDLVALLIQNPYLMLFGGIGLFGFLLALVRRLPLQTEDCLLFPCGIGFIAGMWLIPAPFAHYYLTFLPLLSLFAADSLIRIFEKLSSMRATAALKKWTLSVAQVSVPALVLVGVVCRPHVAAFWFGALMIAVLVLYFRAPALALAVFLLVITVPPQFRTKASLKLRNSQQFEQIRYVLEHTKPNETVMDGFSGVGVFRPHAYFYYMLDWSVALMLPDAEWNALLRQLQTREISPKLVILDRELQQIPRPIVDFFRENYEPAGVGAIWKRKEYGPAQPR